MTAHRDPLETEVWFRNPRLYIRELVDTNTVNVIWDAGHLNIRRVDAARFMELHYPAGVQWRAIVVEGPKRGGAWEFRPGYDKETPFAKYPMWEYGDSMKLLEELIAVNQYEKQGYPHRVIIQGVPSANEEEGRRFYKMLAEIQADYPECIVHVHGLYGYASAFGLGFGAADVEPRTAAANSKVLMPFGSEISIDQALQHGQWVRMLGYTFGDLRIPRKRCMYNIESAKWAGANFRKDRRFFSTRRLKRVDFVSSDMDFIPDETKIRLSTQIKKQEGDKFLCDTCSLQTYCKSYRYGAVCSVPGAETVPLAKLFNTRDSNSIIDGLGTLMATSARRLDQGLQGEADEGELDPEVTKIIGQMFSNGVKLAKLVDPALAGAGAARVNVLNLNNGQQAANPAALVAQVVQQLEASGIPRDEITPAMLEQVLGWSPSTPAAIEPAKVVPGSVA